MKFEKYLNEDILSSIDDWLRSHHGDGMPYITAVKKFGKDTVKKAMDDGFVERDPSFKNFLHLSHKGEKEVKKIKKAKKE